MRARPLVAFLLLALLALPAAAARLEAGSSFTLTREEVQVGDLYFGGSALRLDGPVDGSVAAGCQTATVNGPVSGNVYVGAQTVEIAGKVSGDVLAGCQNLTVMDSVDGAVRAIGSTVSIAGRVGSDVLVGSGTLTIARSAEVVGDVIAGTGTLNIDGTVRGDVRAAAGDILVSGIIDGDLICEVDEDIILTEDARVFGDLRYKADKEKDLGNPDAVFGTVTFTERPEGDEFEDIKPFKPGPSMFTAFLLPFAILSVLAAVCIGFILVAIWKHALVRTIDHCLARFGRTVGFGAIALFAVPVALVVSLALIVTIPAGLIGGGLYLAFLYLSKILAGMFLGRWLFKLFGGHTASIWLTAPVGIILAYALCAVPFVGWLIWLFGALIGFGMVVELLGMSRRV